ncbi:flagellar basal body P-ring protein [Polystyrenella longa]|uniref:Flagellar basal body P-ring protein n=1 Tax=Polystyrenella longa TaxID=2528007 RepID=A0A518CJ74_9PLAN|nr:flagellar basal body P-ring protein FlgI [Polystyrenella longa]QDU79289.1 flagellar basal body P-ring protein [Polystyrenella longa]
MKTQTVITDSNSDHPHCKSFQLRKWCTRTLLGLIFSLSCLSIHAELPSLDDLNPFKKDKFDRLGDQDLDTTLHTPMVGDYTRIGGNTAVRVYGIGLVVGLKGTGDDPPISTQRTHLKREMALKKVKDANRILRSPDTTLVEVKAFLPPLIQKGDLFDIEVHIPGNSEATDLNGGRLLETYLTEVMPTPGEGIKKGRALAVAKGPILVSGDSSGDESREKLRKRGKILSGGLSLKEREMKLYLNSDVRTVRNAKRISDKIGNRFYHYDEYGIRESMAEAKTDTEIDLKIMPQYEDNHARYLNVVRRIAFRETNVAQNIRITRLKDKLLNPKSSEAASLELEAIGIQSIPTLQAGLKSEWLEVRFHSALALAYMGETDGLDVLAEAAEKEHAFRIYALAAMASVEDVESHMKLQTLINKGDITSAETRYGSFRALSTLDVTDPYIRGEDMKGQFSLHDVKTEAAPMIHLTTQKKAEIVLFGRDQQFTTPIVVRAGKDILIKGEAGDKTITISNFHLPPKDQQQVVSTKISEVIRTVVEMGATYPDVAEMLSQADAQKNLPGRLEVNALPQAGQYYVRPQMASGSPSDKGHKIRVGNSNNVPNIFSEQRNHDARLTRSEDGAGYDEVIKDYKFQTASGEEEVVADEDGPSEEALEKSNYVERRTRFFDFKNPFKREE